MKAGFEQRGKVLVMIVCGIIAIAALWYGFSGSSGAASPQPNATSSTATKAAPRATTQGKLREADRRRASQQRSLDPTLHTEWLRASEDVDYKGAKRNIFSAETEPPPQPKNQTHVVDNGPHCPNDADPRCPPVCPNPANPRCPPPPIPLQFYGFASEPGAPKRIFLKTTDTNDVFVAREGEIVNRRYRVVRIMNSAVEVEDVLNNSKQTLPLTQG